MKKLFFLFMCTTVIIASDNQQNVKCFRKGLYNFELFSDPSKCFLANSDFIKNDALEDVYIEAIKTSKKRKAPSYITVILNDPAKYKVTPHDLTNIEKYTGKKIDFPSLPKVGIIMFSQNKNNIETIERCNIVREETIENHILKTIGLKKESDFEYFIMLRFNYDVLEEKGKRPLLIKIKNIYGITNAKTKKEVTIPVNKKFALNYLYTVIDDTTCRTHLVSQKPSKTDNITASKIIKMYPAERATLKKSQSVISYLWSLFFS